MNEPPMDLIGMEWHLEDRQQLPRMTVIDPDTAEVREYARKRPSPVVQVTIDDGDTRTTYRLIRPRKEKS